MPPPLIPPQGGKDPKNQFILGNLESPPLEGDKGGGCKDSLNLPFIPKTDFDDAVNYMLLLVVVVVVVSSPLVPLQRGKACTNQLILGIAESIFEKQEFSVFTKDQIYALCSNSDLY